MRKKDKDLNDCNKFSGRQAEIIEGFFQLDSYDTTFSMIKLTYRQTKPEYFFPNQGTLFFIFQRRVGGASPSCPLVARLIL